MLWIASCAAPARLERELATPTTQPARAACYVGPIDVRVVNPDGTPAADVPLGVFGGSWASDTGENPPPWNGKLRTDEHGRWRRDGMRECAAPTFFYAFDESRNLAGFCLVENLGALTRPKTVRLQPARCVIGEIRCPELEQRGESPDAVCAALSPIREARRRDRWLRYAWIVPAPSHRFRFLVPPGDYWLDVQANGAEWRRNIELRVLPGDGPLDLGTFDLRAKKGTF